jgi:hypothetical protein
MSGRIRTVKPEWAEDERLIMCSGDARTLSVVLMLLADDHGNGRAGPENTIAARAFPRDPSAYTSALAELVAIDFVVLYEVHGQRYFSIRNWGKHQKVDRPSGPRVPLPPARETLASHLGTARDRPDHVKTDDVSARETLAGDPDPDPDHYPDLRAQPKPSAAKEYRSTRQQEHLVSGMWQERERKCGLPGLPLGEDDLRKLGAIIRVANTAKLEIGTVLDEWFRPEWRETFGGGLAQLDKRARDVINAMADPKLRPRLKSPPASKSKTTEEVIAEAEAYDRMLEQRAREAEQA